MYLSFADDLLIFIEGNIESVQCVLQVLKEFEERSELAFRHLGVPINSRKLSLASCEPHILVLIICVAESMYSKDKFDVQHIPVERKH